MAFIFGLYLWKAETNSFLGQPVFWDNLLILTFLFFAEKEKETKIVEIISFFNRSFSLKNRKNSF